MDFGIFTNYLIYYYMNIIFDLDKTLIHSISEDQFTDMKDI